MLRSAACGWLAEGDGVGLDSVCCQTRRLHRAPAFTSPPMFVSSMSRAFCFR